MRVLIIPDIHGRPFWRVAQDMIDDVDKVIFLGDYHDPYPYEGIDTYTSTRNLLDLARFVESHTDKVVMLVGNHDLSYIDGMSVGANRFDVHNYSVVREVFKRLDDKMLLAYALTDNGKDYLFSHAGIVPQWAIHYMPKEVILDVYAVADEVNQWFRNKSHKEDLGDVGACRGGYSDYGSMVWADYSELVDGYLMINNGMSMDALKPDYYQIFGHTQCYNRGDDGSVTFIPFIKDDYACLDCHKPFLLDDGELKEL